MRLRELMEGEFGLPEAVAEIKEAQRQIGVRDRQVSEQNSYINLVQRHLAELVDENSTLRSVRRPALRRPSVICGREISQGPVLCRQ